jgi:hypothetical protein
MSHLIYPFIWMTGCSFWKMLKLMMASRDSVFACKQRRGQETTAKHSTGKWRR